MNRKTLFTAVMIAALLLTGLAAQSASSRAVAQEGQPEASLAPAVDVASSFTYQGYMQRNPAST